MTLVDVPKPITLPQRMRDLADRLEKTDLKTLFTDVAMARELLRIAADRVELTTADITRAASAFDRAREKLDAFLAGQNYDPAAPCGNCGEELYEHDELDR